MAAAIYENRDICTASGIFLDVDPLSLKINM